MVWGKVVFAIFANFVVTCKRAELERLGTSQVAGLFPLP